MFASQAVKVDNANRGPYNAVGLLKMKWSDDQWYKGTGALIDSQHVLTCSHNLVDQQNKENAGYAKEVIFYPGHNSQQEPVGGIKASFCFYSMNYFRGEDAWDVGIVRLVSPTTAAKGHYFKRQNIIDSSQVEKEVNMVGYPGNKNGEMWIDIDEVAGIELTTNTVLVTHDTFKGSSGSPIYKYNSLDDQVLQYGIHVSRQHDKLRRGVLLTQNVNDWIKQALNTFPIPGPLLYGL